MLANEHNCHLFTNDFILQDYAMNAIFFSGFATDFPDNGTERFAWIYSDMASNLHERVHEEETESRNDLKIVRSSR
jgi:hypothetical protein